MKTEAKVGLFITISLRSIFIWATIAT